MNSGMKATYNQAMLDIAITPVAPLLIKAADNLDATKPDMQFVRLRLPQCTTVYLPGSSLKGAIRSCFERLLRSQDIHACDPTAGGCSKKKQLHYRDHCYACRTFGSTNLASRVSFSDAFPWGLDAEEDKRKTAADDIEKKYIQVRPGVAIDRRKGKVAAGPFDLEVVTGGTFYSRVVLRNYQLWQLGLLLHVFDEMNSGAQKLGFAKSRGLGQVQVEPQRLLVRQMGILAEDAKKLAGIGLVTDIVNGYKLVATDSITLETPGNSDMLGVSFDFNKENQTLFDGLLNRLKTSDSLRELLNRSRGHDRN